MASTPKLHHTMFLNSMFTPWFTPFRLVAYGAAVEEAVAAVAVEESVIDAMAFVILFVYCYASSRNSLEVRADL